MKRPQYVFRPQLSIPDHRRAWTCLQQMPANQRKDFLVRAILAEEQRDMFSGIGGFREGLTRAGGFECVGHCEIDKYANRSYNALFDTKGEWFIEDARKADPSTMPDFQLLCGGFPCQTYPE